MSEPLQPRLELPGQPNPAAGGPDATMPPSFEDASSQALSEALRSSFQVVRFIMLGLVLIFLCSGVLIVQPNEQVILLRLGKPVGTGEERLLRPGWHWAYPYPIDEPVRIKIGQSQTVTSTTGWYAVDPAMTATNAEPQAYGFLRPEAEGYTLTGDGGIIHVRATIKYRVTKPLRYYLDFTSVPTILTNIVNEAIFYASARFTADQALFKDRVGFREAVVDRVREQIAALDLGITLEPSDVDTRPPADVRNAFLSVNNAEQTASTDRSKAQSYRDEVTRTAVGQAQALINSGLMSSNWLVAQVAADARAFTDQLPRYLENPELFKRRLLATTMERVLTNASVKFTLPEQFDELRLQLSREPEKVESKETR